MGKDDFINLFNMLDISKKELLSLARETGFIERIRKIDSLDFMYALAMESMHGIASYNDIAVSIENDNGTTISRQAIWKKVTESCVDYFQQVLELVILSKVNVKKYLPEMEIAKCKFRRVLIQDSTIVKLPKRLFESFSGVSNGSSKVCNARIQGVYDLLTGRFISFSINPYSKNDHSSASEMEIQKDDLTLRDRGYLSVDELKRHLLNSAHCIYRHKIHLQLLDYDTEKPLDLLSILRKNGSIDIVVKLNDKERTVVRLVAKPVDQETSNNRRMKAKKEMKGHKPGKLFLELQSWSIFITTIPPDQADFNTLLKIYGLRWRIETIFKSWKSNLHFDYIHNVSNYQLIIILLARMIMFLIITQIIYTPCNKLVSMHMDRNISLLKLTKYLNRNTIKLESLLNDLKNYPGILTQSINIIARFCTYEKRNRLNFDQKIRALYT
jgi:hypothetical protein